MAVNSGSGGFDQVWENVFDLTPTPDWDRYAAGLRLERLVIPTLDPTSIPALANDGRSISCLTSAAEQAFNLMSNNYFQAPAVVISLQNQFQPAYHQSELNLRLQNIRRFNFVGCTQKVAGKTPRSPDVFYDTLGKNESSASNVVNVRTVCGKTKDIAFSPTNKKLTDLEAMIIELAGGAKKSIPFNRVVYNGFSHPEYLGPFNPYCTNDVLSYLPESDEGVNSPCLVTLQSRMVTPLYVNDLKLAEYDLLVWAKSSDLTRIHRIHIVIPPSGLERMKDDEFLGRIARLEDGDAKKCPSFYAGQRFIFTLKFLFKLKIGFYVLYQRLGDALLVRPGCMRFSISLTCNQSVGVNFWMMEWLDISDRFVKCECPFPRTSVDPDDEGLSRERPHGMDKSELHQPGYFTTAQTRWLEAQRFAIGSTLFCHLANRFPENLPNVGDLPEEDDATASNNGDQQSVPGSIVIAASNEVVDELASGATASNFVIDQPHDVASESATSVRASHVADDHQDEVMPSPTSSSITADPYPSNIDSSVANFEAIQKQVPASYFREPWPNLIGGGAASRSALTAASTATSASNVSLTSSGKRKNGWKIRDNVEKNRSRRASQSLKRSLAGDRQSIPGSPAPRHTARSDPGFSSGLIPTPASIAFLEMQKPSSALGPLAVGNGEVVVSPPKKRKKRSKNKTGKKNKKRKTKKKAVAGNLPNPDEKSAESVEGSVSGKSKENAPAIDELSD